MDPDEELMTGAVDSEEQGTNTQASVNLAETRRAPARNQVDCQ